MAMALENAGMVRALFDYRARQDRDALDLGALVAIGHPEVVAVDFN